MAPCLGAAAAAVICAAVAGGFIVVGCAESPAEPGVVHPRTVEFSGHTWRIRSNDVPRGPGPNYFSDSTANVWVDDSASSLYNTHQRTPVNGRWASAEKLLNQPAYNYAQVIGYNEARTPGRGSAIFLHVDKGAGTAGCVSLPTGPLLAVLRWERAGAVIAIR